MDERLAVLDATAGVWKGRTESTETVLTGLRTGRIARLRVDEPDRTAD